MVWIQWSYKPVESIGDMDKALIDSPPKVVEVGAPPVRSIEVIVNARAGLVSKAEMRGRILELFRDLGTEARVSIARNGSHLVELANTAAERSDVVVGAGGDGTINTVASAVRAKQKILGVLPLGTLNHFARDLNIPWDLKAAVHTIVSGSVTNVDVGEVNGHMFLNNSSLGLYPSIVTERRKKQRLGHGKWPAFVWAALSVLRRHPFLDVRLTAEGKQTRARTPFVFIGNNEYATEGFKIGGRTSLTEGVLSVLVTFRIGRWGLIRLALRALLGRLSDDKDLVSLTTDQVWIETRRKRLHIARDGEVSRMKSPLHYRVLPNALRVMVPPAENL